MGAGEQVEHAIHLLGGFENARWGEHHSAVDFRGVNAAEVDGGSLTGISALDRRVVDLKAADAGALRGWVYLYFVVHGERSGNQGPGDHRAVAAHGKAAVDGQTGMAGGVFSGDRVGCILKHGAQFV